MAHHKSCKKRIKQTIVKNERNRYYRTRIKNLTNTILEAIEAGNKDNAVKALAEINKKFHSFVSKGILKKGTASRKVSRFTKKVNAL